jgi:hypothetical protein
MSIIYSITVMWISDILVRFRGSVALTYDPDSDTAPDPVFSSAADQRPTKNIFFSPKLYAYYFLKVHLLTAGFKDKTSKSSQK